MSCHDADVPRVGLASTSRQGKIPKVKNLGKYVKFDQGSYKQAIFPPAPNRSFSTEYSQQRKQSAFEWDV